MRREHPEYEIGYKKPPRQTRSSVIVVHTEEIQVRFVIAVAHDSEARDMIGRTSDDNDCIPSSNAGGDPFGCPRPSQTVLDQISRPACVNGEDREAAGLCLEHHGAHLREAIECSKLEQRGVLLGACRRRAGSWRCAASPTTTARTSSSKTRSWRT